MEYDQFLHRVRACAGLASTEQAVTATRAALETLADRIRPEQCLQLAARLPAEASPWLAPRAGEAPAISFDAFCQRLADREGADVPVAVFHARAVMHVLREVVTPEEIEAMAATLPNDYAPLFWPLADTKAAA